MLVAFASGAFNYWLPLYLHRLHRVKRFMVLEARFWFGILSAAARFLGVVSVGDRLARWPPAGRTPGYEAPPRG